VALVYEKEKFDLIGFQQWMYVAFTDHVKINPQYLEIKGVEFIPGETAVSSIGKIKKGKTSYSYQELRMLPDTALVYIGTFGDLLLFSPYEYGSRKFDDLPKDKDGFFLDDPLNKYRHVFVGLYDLGDDFSFATSSNSTRLLSKDFEFIEIKKEQKIVKATPRLKRPGLLWNRGGTYE
jgi:hypothetical protein